MRGLAGLSLLFSVLASVPEAGAGAFTREGLTFSDELGGFRLVQVGGTGSLEDPFVVMEEIDGQGPAILLITGLTADFGNRAGTQHLTGFAMVKVAVNAGRNPWREFRLELRESELHASPYGDGLSFAQAAIGRPVASDVFRAVRAIDEPFDSLVFDDGKVEPGGTAEFRFLVTDESPVPRVLLVQEVEPPLAEHRPPAAFDRGRPALALRPGAAPDARGPGLRGFGGWQGPVVAGILAAQSLRERQPKIEGLR
jgi:hypothetical protein